MGFISACLGRPKAAVKAGLPPTSQAASTLTPASPDLRQGTGQHQSAGADTEGGTDAGGTCLGMSLQATHFIFGGAGRGTPATGLPILNAGASGSVRTSSSEMSGATFLRLSGASASPSRDHQAYPILARLLAGVEAQANNPQVTDAAPTEGSAGLDGAAARKIFDSIALEVVNTDAACKVGSDPPRSVRHMMLI